MPSFNVVNYSLRPNKSIQRSLVFEGVRLLQKELHLEKLMYIGFGSIWFTDFQMAHKLLGVEDMISIEADPVGFRRALFNQPFKTVRVINGYSHDVFPSLLSDPNLACRPWLVWLDYDHALNEAIVEDVQTIIEKAPPNSILLVTIDAKGSGYGRPVERPKRLKGLLGSVVPDELDRRDCADGKLWSTIAELTWKFMVSVRLRFRDRGDFYRRFASSTGTGHRWLRLAVFSRPRAGFPQLRHLSVILCGQERWPN